MSRSTASTTIDSTRPELAPCLECGLSELSRTCMMSFLRGLRPEPCGPRREWQIRSTPRACRSGAELHWGLSLLPHSRPHRGLAMAQKGSRSIWNLCFTRARGARGERARERRLSLDGRLGAHAGHGSTRAFAHRKETKAPEGATAGAAAGGIVGGTLGVLVALGSLAISGVGHSSLPVRWWRVLPA